MTKVGIALTMILFAILLGADARELPALISSIPTPTPSALATPTPTPMAVITRRGGIPLRLEMLNRELGIPLEELLTMSDEQIQQLMIENAVRLGLDAYVSDDGIHFRWVAGPHPPQPVATPPAPTVPQAGWTAGQRDVQRYFPLTAKLGRPEGEEANIRRAIQRGIDFLKHQYNPALGLLQESPNIGQRRYYLNDAALAAYTLEVLGEQELAATLRASLQRYGYENNGFCELAWGEPIRWPPYHHEDVIVDRIGEDEILLQTHPRPGYFYDWSAYSNLAFMAVLNEYTLGYPESARRLYEIEMSTFDGLGWPDKAYWDRQGVYETLGLAWAVYAGAKIGMEVDPRVVGALLEEQGDSGGFHTHYQADARRQADPNIETTSIALLGLNALLER